MSFENLGKKFSTSVIHISKYRILKKVIIYYDLNSFSNESTPSLKLGAKVSSTFT